MGSQESLPDEWIVAAIVGGDVDSYAEIMTRYEPKLMRYVTYLIHDSTTAQDVVQDTFIKAYQHMASYNPKYKFSSWLYRIAHNEAMNAIKKSSHRSNKSIDEVTPESYEQHVEELVDANILKAHVHHCLEQLEPKYREVIQLVYFEHMKYDDASDVLHIPTSTVGVWLTRAKAKLQVICKRRGVAE